MDEVIKREVFGPTSESVSIAYRGKGIRTKQAKLLRLSDMILSNGSAGLIDLNLNQKQVVQSARCSPRMLNDYSWHRFVGTPKEGQSLDDVKSLLLEQIEKLKKGEFEDWLIDAVINDVKLRDTRNFETSTGLGEAYYEAFIHNQDWVDKVEYYSELKKISKQEIVDFANSFYRDNYVVTYKRKGQDKNLSLIHI